MFLATSEQMRAFDQRTITTLRVPGIILMEHAGKEVAAEVARQRPTSVLVVCGKGNNGGDGWIAARWLKHWGIPDVRVVSLVAPGELSGDARLAAEMAQAANVEWRVYTVDEAGQTALPAADVTVDALLGTGGQRPLTGVLQRLVAEMQQSVTWMVSVDVPTGVNGSTGEVMGTAVKADVTVCLGLRKLGTAISPGCYHAGTVKVVDIGIAVTSVSRLATLVTAADVRRWLPARGPESHKGTFGRVGIAVGQMQGAAVLAGWGAARAGAGLILLGHAGQTPPAAPAEFIVRDVSQPANGAFHDCQAVVIGPGLGAGAEAWRTALLAPRGVLDADGLQLAGPALTAMDAGQWVLTPHPKECARLLGWTTEQVQARRLHAAQTLAAQTQAIVVLKGWHSVIARFDGAIRVNPTGDASLATAGTGDILAGIIGGLLAQGLDPFDAAACGAWIHGRAGELAGQRMTPVSVTASDVVETISRAIHLLFDMAPGDGQLL